MSIQKSIYEQLILESSDRSRTIDVSTGAISIDYYEDIFSPTITEKLKLLTPETQLLLKVALEDNQFIMVSP